MSKTILALAGAAFALTVGSASAAPVSPLSLPDKAVESQVVTVQKRVVVRGGGGAYRGGYGGGYRGGYRGGVVYRGGGGYYRGYRGYAYARPGYRYYGGWYYPSAAFGAAVVGAAVGAAIVAAPPAYAAPVGDGHVQWCLSQYRSYDPASDTFQPYEGPRQRCVSPY